MLSSERGKGRERETGRKIEIVFFSSFSERAMDLSVPYKIYHGGHLLCIKIKNGTPKQDLPQSVIGQGRLKEEVLKVSDPSPQPSLPLRFIEMLQRLMGIPGDVFHSLDAIIPLTVTYT